jgi:hypothetical protein
MPGQPTSSCTCLLGGPRVSIAAANGARRGQGRTGNLALHELELCHLLAELFPLVRVLDGVVACCLHQSVERASIAGQFHCPGARRPKRRDKGDSPQWPTGQDETLEIQTGHEHIDALVDRSQHVVACTAPCQHSLSPTLWAFSPRWAYARPTHQAPRHPQTRVHTSRCRACPPCRASAPS